MRCESYKSCLNSTIKNVDNIVSYGNNSLSGSKIISGSSSKLKIDIFESNIDFSFDIYCQNSSKCEINCRSRDSCSLLNIYCYSNARCSICCHETQFNCPKTRSDKTASVIFDSNCYAYGPTSIPSDIPSDTSSDTPSDTPSGVPTHISTGIPTTGIPTSIPTSIPTKYYSEHPSFVPLLLPSSAPSTQASEYTNVSTDIHNTTFTEIIGETPTKNISNETQGGNGNSNNNNNNKESAPHWLLYIAIGFGVLAVVFAWCYYVEKRKRKREKEKFDNYSKSSNNSKDWKSKNQVKNPVLVNNHSEQKTAPKHLGVSESPEVDNAFAIGDYSGDEQSGPEISNSEMAIFKTKTIINPLVVFLGIGVYNLKQLRNLNGVKFDYKQLIETFVKKYNYKVLYALSKNKNKNKNNKIKKNILKNIIHDDFDYVYTNNVEMISNINNFKLKWTHEEISSLASKARKHIVQNKHDGMLFALSCHGDENKIIYVSTAKDQQYNLDNLYNVFKSTTPAVLYHEKQGESKHLSKIPKIFIVDSCRGTLKENVSNLLGNESTIVNVDEKTHDNYDNDNFDVDRDDKKDGRGMIPSDDDDDDDSDDGDDDDDENLILKSITASQAEYLASPEANFCYIFPTTEGHAAAERKNEGGYLIQSVCKVFNNTDFVIGKTLETLIKQIRMQTKMDATVYKKGREKAKRKKFKKKKNYTQTVENQGTLEYNVTFNKNE